jgi:hypothetical protein
MFLRRSEKLALIHLARKDRALDEDAYRGLLYGAAGVASAGKIDTEEQFEAVMKAFSNLGFVRSPAKSKRLPVRNEQRNNYSTGRQLYYIKGLWELASRSKDEKSLRGMVKRIGHVEDLRFLANKDATALILALRDICWKAGMDPDGPSPRVPSENKAVSS